MGVFKKIRLSRLAGGSTTRAEAYGLFFAAVLVLAGSVGGVYALSSGQGSAPSGSPIEISSESQTSSKESSSETSGSEDEQEQIPSGGSTNSLENSSGSSQDRPSSNANKPDGSNQPGTAQSPSACRYNASELAYFAQQRGDLEAQLPALITVRDLAQNSYTTSGQRASAIAYAQSMVNQWNQWLVSNPNAQTDNPASYENVVNNLIPFWQGELSKVSNPSWIPPFDQQRVDQKNAEIQEIQRRISLIPSC